MRLAETPGRFICDERPLLYYRVHEDATTKACIRDNRRFEEERQDAWRLWPQEKPEEDGEYIVQIEGAVQATALWYRKEGQEWHDLYEEQEVYRIIKWQTFPEV
mgnify:CR=1 FL=1